MKDLYVYMFRSRNKDNTHLLNFHERYKTVLAYAEDEEQVRKDFERFVAEGVPGEKTRLYRSVNRRDETKVREYLTIRLIKDKPSMTKLNAILASAAQQTENRAESKWLFDFDEENMDLVNEFVTDILNHDPLTLTAEVHKTPNGYAIVVNHGFDTREIMEKWKDYDITLKRDELLFLDIKEA